MATATVVVALVVAIQGAQQAPQMYGDRAAAEQVMRAYRDAWLSNDPGRVMATLSSDAVIYPSNLLPIAGTVAIRQFWFPLSGPSTRVIGMELTFDSVAVDSDIAVVSGTGSLTFIVTTNGTAAPPRTQRSWHVNVLRRQPDGRWLIWRRMWADLKG